MSDPIIITNDELVQMTLAYGVDDDWRWRDTNTRPVVRRLIANLRSDRTEVERLRAENERLRDIVRMFHDPQGCRYPAVGCTVCEATT